ncbi:MAG TPA: HAD family hydrolase [Solirubrobacteraceae bacterium]|jgi:phosphoglycolate phosphatase-like HAD superfamily hydrolase
MAVRYVIFDLDDTLVHSAAVRRAFSDVAADHGITPEQVDAACDELPGRPAAVIFQALGLGAAAAEAAAARFVAQLEALNAELPTIPYPDAGETLRAVREHGVHMILSTGSPAERAQRVLAEAGWEGFELVLGSGPARRKGAEHFDAMCEHLHGGEWAGQAATVGDSPEDMRLGAENGVPVRIGLARRCDPAALLRAGATHVVRSLADIVPIIAAA